jgi:hypothetical protein
MAEASVEVPTASLRRTVGVLGADGDEVLVTGLGGDKATVLVRRRVTGEGIAEQASSDLRIALAERLQAAGG